jgi:hypothetical protein
MPYRTDVVSQELLGSTVDRRGVHNRLCGLEQTQESGHVMTVLKTNAA